MSMTVEALNEFTEWLAREMPSGTVISDPEWWGRHIVKRISGKLPWPYCNADEDLGLGGNRYLRPVVSHEKDSQPPKDAGAVPLPEVAATVCLTPDGYAHGHMLDLQVQVAPTTTFAIGDKLCRWADAIRYGNAREAAACSDAEKAEQYRKGWEAGQAAGRADAVPQQGSPYSAKGVADGYRWEQMRAALRTEADRMRLHKPHGQTWTPVIQSDIDQLLLVAEDATRTDAAAQTLQHPPADPLDAAIAKGTKAWAGVPDSFVEDLRGDDAARAQVGVPSAKKWVDENGVEVTAEWMAGWDACRVEYPRAHPSPAHAGAGAEALSESVLMEYARRKGWPVTLNKSVPAGDGTWYHHWDITIPTHELAKFFPAHRLAGGDHA